MRFVTETLLEMHYHRAFVDLFAQTLGLRFLRLLKPSPNVERWVGFDQGWVRTGLSSESLINELRSVASGTAAPPRDLFYLAYFLQFKVVTELSRGSKHKPKGYPNPYYRVELSLSPDTETRISQHETLLRIAQLPRCSVNYVCPFFWSEEDIYAEPDLGSVQVVDIRSAPSGWVTNERHFIAFRDVGDNAPKWCSEESDGAASTPLEWIRAEGAPVPLYGQDVYSLLTQVNDYLGDAGDRQPSLLEHERMRRWQYLPACTTLLQFEKVPDSRRRR